MNNISIMGNVGNINEMRTSTNGKSILNFSVAVNRRFNGEDETTWFRCVSFAGLADMLNTHLTKGAKVAVTGRMSCNKWTDKEGNNRDSWELIVNDFYFAGSKQDNSGGGQRREPERAPQGGFDDDVPF